MLRYLLDTNICIYVIKQRLLPLLEVFNSHAGMMAISAITLSELLHGAKKSAAPQCNLAVVENFCSHVDVLTYGPKASLHYGQIRTALELCGTPIGVNDLHIAAYARSEGKGSPWSATTCASSSRSKGFCCRSGSKARCHQPARSPY
jgi:tRNA(fMet)-specific endonuclease VapC